MTVTRIVFSRNRADSTQTLGKSPSVSIVPMHHAATAIKVTITSTLPFMLDCCPPLFYLTARGSLSDAHLTRSPSTKPLLPGLLQTTTLSDLPFNQHPARRGSRSSFTSQHSTKTVSNYSHLSTPSHTSAHRTKAGLSEFSGVVVPAHRHSTSRRCHHP